MAYLKAYKTGMSGNYDRIYIEDEKEALKTASELMAKKVERFTTASGAVSVKPYCRVAVFDDSDNFITMAWGE